MFTYHLNSRKLSLVLLLLLGFIWGTGYSIARFATTHGVAPLGYSFWQSLGPAIVLCLLLQRKHHQAPRDTSTTHNMIYYLVCALTGIVIPNSNMYFAAPHLPAGLLAVIVNTVPIMAYPLALWMGAESFQWSRLLGIAAAIGGLMLIVLPKTSLPSAHMVPWVLSALITPLSFAFCSVYISRYQPKQAHPLALSARTLLFSSILLLPLVLFTKSFYVIHIPFTLPDWVILLEIALSSIGYVLFFKLIKLAGPVYYSLVNTVVSLTGLFWGYVIFHEKLNEWTAPAVILILLALILITKKQAEAQSAWVPAQQ